MEPNKVLPLKYFESAPVFGKKVITMTLQVESDNELSIIFSGATWGYRGKFEAHGVKGGTIPGTDNSQGYYRFLKNLDISSEDNDAMVRAMLGDAVLSNLALKVVVQGEPEPDSAVSEFIESLKDECPHLHFAA